MQALFSIQTYPNLSEFSTEHVMRPDYDFGEEFEFGLAVILDALAARLSEPDAVPA